MNWLRSSYVFVWGLLEGIVSGQAQQVVIYVKQIPQNTPSKSQIYIAGDFNNWYPAAEDYQLKLQADGSYAITIKLPKNNAEYKFTRGGWDKVETDASGQDVQNRKINVQSKDTIIEVKIDNWKDLTIATEKPSTAASNVYILDTQFEMPQLKRKRRIWILLPLDYHLTDKKYPVVYMQDGQNLFDNRSAFAGEWQVDKHFNYLQQQGAWGCIVVGVDNGGTDRINEYSAYMNFMGGGDGNEYVEFIAYTLKPHIDKHYRTLSDRTNTAIWGSSMGGLIAYYAGIKYPHIFQNLGVFSPSFWFSQQYFTLTEKTKKTQEMRMYFLGGEQEGGNMIKNINLMVKKLYEAGYKEHEIKVVGRADGQHSEWFWARELNEAYRWLFAHVATQKYANTTAIAGKKDEFMLFPNPTTQYLHSKLPENMDCKVVKIKVIDKNQKVVQQAELLKQQVLNLQGLKKGMYLLQLQTDSNQLFSQEIELK